MRKDPVCGMRVDERHAPATSDYAGATYFFCSPYCQEQFDQQPERYARTLPVRYTYSKADGEDEPMADEAEERRMRRHRHRQRSW